MMGAMARAQWLECNRNYCVLDKLCAVASVPALLAHTAMLGEQHAKHDFSGIYNKG
jgi:hypothetical protein